MGPIFNENFIKKKLVSPVNSIRNPSIDTFFSFGCYILITVAMGPTDYKRQPQTLI